MALSDSSGCDARLPPELRDLSTRLAADAALRELLAGVSAVGVVLHRAGVALWMNEAFANLFGEPAEALVGRNLLETVHPEDRGRVVDRMRLAETGPYEARLQRPDGSVIHVEVHGRAVRHLGEPMRLAEFRDITARIDAAEALRRSETTLRIAGDLARFGGWRVDLAANRVHWTDQVAAIHGMPAGFSPTVEEGIAFYAPECRARITEVFTDCATRGIPYDEELQILDAAGRSVDVRTIGVPVRDEAGRIVAVAGAFQDLTERKAAEARERALHARLERAQKLESLGRLAGGVAHDFHNMLQVILGRAEALRDRLPADDPACGDLDEILAAGRHAAAVTRQLLGFARRQPAMPRPIDLAATARGCLALLRRLIRAEIEIDLVPPDGLPAVHADPAQIEQVLANLCVNAADAIAGAGRILVEIAAVDLEEGTPERPDEVPAGRYVRLSVRDDGSGMLPEVLARAFDPFFTTKEIGKGTGLGLSTVYGIARQNGGFARIESAPGSGTTVAVHLPALPDRPAADGVSPVAASPETGAEGERGDGRTVLVVDDDPVVRRFVLALLRSLGYAPVAVASPAEALALLGARDEPVHLLLADVAMPGMNGRALAAEAARIVPGIAALFMSGYTREEILRDGWLEESALYLQKPFRRAEFAAMLRRALGMSEAAGDADGDARKAPPA